MLSLLHATDVSVYLIVVSAWITRLCPIQVVLLLFCTFTEYPILSGLAAIAKNFCRLVWIYYCAIIVAFGANSTGRS